MRLITILLTFCLFTTASMARFSDADIAAEVQAYDQLQRHARGLLQPIREDAKMRTEQVAAPFRAQLEPLQQRIDALRQERNPLSQEHDDLRRSLYGIEREMRPLEEREMEEALRPLEEELIRRRVPIQAELQRLAAREQEITNNYYKWKAQMGRAWDHIDEMDIGFRLGAVETARKSLFASVDGDFPERISQTRSGIMDQYRERKEAREREISAAMERLSLAIGERDAVIEGIDREIQAIWSAEREALEGAVGFGTAERLLPDLERMMIAGMPIG